MRHAMKGRSDLIFWIVLAVPVVWLGLLAASCMSPGEGFGDWMASFTEQLSSPHKITLNAYSLKAVSVCLICYVFAVLLYISSQGNTRRGEEYGSAKWSHAKQLDAIYRNRKSPEENFILTKKFSLGMDSHRHQKNLNVLVIGGSGSGKSRGFSMPNAMNCSCSYLITDPKGEITSALAPMFLAKGIEVTIFDLVDPARSDGFNPFQYIRTDLDAMRLVSNLIKNTTPPNAHQNDPFWEKSEIALFTALILYLKHEAPEDEQNFGTIMYMIENCSASEDDEEHRSPVDVLFEMLEERDPNHIAVKQYKVFKQAAGVICSKRKISQSRILLSAA